MTNRTVKALGWGQGTALITAIIDGETVFSEDVELVEYSDSISRESDAPTLFTFEIPIEFDGTKQMKITVEKAQVRFGYIVANYTEVDNFGTVYLTGSKNFADISPEINGVRDPRGNVKINGFAKFADRAVGNGTWHWTVNPGSILEHDLHIKAGVDDESFF
jgi:hypothetical protein